MNLQWLLALLVLSFFSLQGKLKG
jgi:hypothetical protein